MTINNRQVHTIKSFFFGQYFESGLRTTFGIVFPALFFAYFNNYTVGITLSLGALCVGITDLPGPFLHKRNGMLVTNLFIFLTALLTGFLSPYPWLLALEIPLMCFFFAMVNVYGIRASLAGTGALLIMMISTDQNHLLNGVVEHAFYVLGGGVWYMCFSLLVTTVRPYRLAQQVLGEGILSVSDYLKIRAKFYDGTTPIEENYSKLTLQQITVNKNLDDIREILFKSGRMINERTGTGKLLIQILRDIIDLFEFGMSIPYDYSKIRPQYSAYNILPEIAGIVNKCAFELENIGHALISNRKPVQQYDIFRDLELLKEHIDSLERKQISVFVLKKVLVNLINLNTRVNTLLNYFHKDHTKLPGNDRTELDKFVSHQKIDLYLFRNNLTLNSITFRHAIRLAVACFAGFLIAQLLSFGQHSYWILVTILVILKPGYGLTKQRNYERVIGTLVGGLAGVLLLVFVEDKTINFFLLLVFMVLTFTFQRIKYVISVLFMTPFVLILFSFVSKSGNMDIVKERIIDTLTGSFIALVANYFVFPNWESKQINTFLSATLKANLDYFHQILSRVERSNFSITAYKLARKEVYVQAANLSSAFQRMLNEPKKRQKQITEVQQFIVFNHILSSHLATLSASIQSSENRQFSAQEQKYIRMINTTMQDTILLFEKSVPNVALAFPDTTRVGLTAQEDTLSAIETLKLIHRVSLDLAKISRNFEQ